MKSKPLVVERTLEAPIAEVWKALTNEEAMHQWYFDLPAFKAEAGYEFRFLAGTDEKKYLHLCKITEVITGEKLAYSWRYDGYPGLSYVTFELSADGDRTRLKLTHEGLESFPADDPNFARPSFVQGWNHIINTALADFLENR